MKMVNQSGFETYFSQLQFFPTSLQVYQCYCFIIFFYQIKFMFQSSSLQTQTMLSPSLSMSKTTIEQRYIFKRFIRKYEQYSVYEGIDLNALKLTTIYLKQENSPINFSKRIKEDLVNKISPKILWSGNYKIDKNKCTIQIHEKYGPSLKLLFDYIKKPISQRDFLLLMFQLIRLVEKYATVGYVYRQLDMRTIIFDSKPQRNDVFLINVFPLRKKGEDTRILSTRFCSKGAHLGLKPFVKDDLQSVCYILLNIHTQNQFLKNVQPQQYLQHKANINFNSLQRTIHPLFIDFYNYVMNLNYNDEVNFFKWRNIIYNIIGKQSITRPFEWLSKERLLTNGDKLQLQDEIKPSDQSIDNKIKSIKVISKGSR